MPDNLTVLRYKKLSEISDGFYVEINYYANFFNSNSPTRSQALR